MGIHLKSFPNSEQGGLQQKETYFVLERKFSRSSSSSSSKSKSSMPSAAGATSSSFFVSASNASISVPRFVSSSSFVKSSVGSLDSVSSFLASSFSSLGVVFSGAVTSFGCSSVVDAGVSSLFENAGGGGALSTKSSFSFVSNTISSISADVFVCFEGTGDMVSSSRAMRASMSSSRSLRWTLVMVAVTTVRCCCCGGSAAADPKSPIEKDSDPIEKASNAES
mmetsp:Transcript_3942/g.8918  ORF Transcript_3942/g.8918 Transcript_3942/m.8918 type:complete len:223 (-) Transcript_3942:1633-2301(-)